MEQKLERMLSAASDLGSKSMVVRPWIESDHPPCCTADTPGCEKYSPANLRFQAYTAILHRACGVWLKSNGPSTDQCAALSRLCERDTLVSPYFRDTIVPLTNERESMNRFLGPESESVVGKRLCANVSSGSTANVTMLGVGDSPHFAADLQLGVYTSGTEVALICANVSSRSITRARFDLSAMSLGNQELQDAVMSARSVRVFGDASRTSIASEGGIFTDAFAPKSVHVYRWARRSVPGDFQTLDVALQEWQPGDVLYVGNQVSGLPWVGKVHIRGGMALIGTGLSAVALDGNGSDTTVVINSNSGNVTFRNFRVINFTHAGIRAEGQSDSSVRIDSCVVDGAGAAIGIDVRGIGLKARVERCVIKNVDGNAVQITGGGSEPVTVENCTIEGGAYATRNGVVSSSASVRVVNCAFVGPSAKGIQLGVDFWDTGTRSLLVSGCRFSNVDATGVSRAIHVSAGSGPVHVEGNTTWNYEYGVEMVAGTTGAVFRKNLFAIGTYAGVGIFGNPPSTNNVVENNNCWGFIYNYSVNGYHGTIPPGNLSSDPVFCSTTDLTLNLTSPCARANNPWGVWIGARPYVSCMSGTLGANWDLGTADTQGGTVSMPGDFKVPSGTGLVLRAPLDIKVEKTPLGANLGSDASRVELLIDGGRVETRGTLTSPVILASAETSPTVSDWYGVRVTNGGEAILKGTQVRDSVYGLYSGSSPDSIRIEDCTISHNSTACVRILAAGGASSNIYVKGGTMSVASPSTAPEAFYATNPKSLFIDKLTVLGGSTAAYGIRVTGPGGGGSEAEVWESSVSGFPAGSGLYSESSSAAFRGCTVTDCKWGSNFQISGNPSLTALSVTGRSASTAISGCTTGAYITGVGAGKPSITGGTITAGTSSGIVGLYTEGAITGYYKSLTISGGHTAVKANSQGPDTLMNSCVTGFASVGVQVTIAGQIVLGGVSSKANNIYSSVAGVSKYVTVKTPRIPGTPDVDAQYNWWGESPAPSTKFSNYVNYANALTGPVSCTGGSRAFTMNRDVPLMRPFAVHPNPSTNQVVMSFSVPVGLQAPVELRVFDVSGRLVRTLLNERLAPGEVEARWDGKDGAGRVMPGGLFFARLKVGTEIQTRKIIRLSR